MKATLRIDDTQRLQIEATAGDVLLQLITDQPMSIRGSYPPKVATARLTATQAAILIDTLAGVACVAEEQAYEIDLAAALKPLGMQPRDLRATADDLASTGTAPAPSWANGGGKPCVTRPNS